MIHTFLKLDRVDLKCFRSDLGEIFQKIFRKQ